MQSGLFYKAATFLTGRQIRSTLTHTPASHSTFILPNGYRLAYNEYGNAHGFPLLYFHDAGSSRLEAAFFDQVAKEQGFRLIAIDRPGIGSSDYYVMQSACDFCEDVLRLLESLEIHRFAVMTFGAGGIYGTTLSYMQASRILFHLNLGGVPGTVFNDGYTGSKSKNLLLGFIPAIIKTGVLLRYLLIRDQPEQALSRLAGYLSQMDRKVLASPRVRQLLLKDQREVFRQGARGVAQDVAMCFRKLDFQLQDISVPTQVWQGSADRRASRPDSEYFVARLSSARFYRVSNRGHFFFVNCMNEVFGRLRQDAGLLTRLAA